MTLGTSEIAFRNADVAIERTDCIHPFPICKRLPRDFFYHLRGDDQTLSERSDHRNRSENDFGLGAIQFVQVEPYIWVANMVAQRGMKAGSNGPPIRYEAVRSGLKKLAPQARSLEASVHMPRIGCGLAGGRWDEIEPIIVDELIAAGVEVTVYDFG